MRVRNPYDFRNPTRPDLLIGREDELDEIEKHLTAAADDRPVHIALLGERAAGKTSILDAVEPRVKEHRLIPVRVNLDEGATSTAYTFFKSIFEAVIHRLVSEGIVKSDDPRYGAWRRQVHAGDTTVLPSDELLQFGMIAASLATGGTPPDISAALLAADTEVLIRLAREADYHGIVLLIDEANLIGTNPTIIQKLRNLVQAINGLMLILAGTTQVFASLREVFSPIPRQFVRIAVEQFESLSEVIECVRRPLFLAEEKVPRESFEAAVDIFKLTNGRPYEINLVCYHIWQALLDGHQDKFEITPLVLDKMLSELLNMGQFERQLDADEVGHIRDLSTDDFEIAATVLPYEGYTLEEHVRARLFPASFSEDALLSKRAAVTTELKKLERLGVVDLVADRFRFRGGSYARAYLKFAARHHATEHSSHDLSFERPYSIRMVEDLVELMLRDLFEGEYGQAELVTRGFRHQIGDTGVNRRLTQFDAAIRGRDIARMASARLVAPAFDWMYQRGRVPGGLLFTGLVFAVTVDKLEHATIMHNRLGQREEDWRSAVTGWLEDNSALLTRYLVSVEEVFVTALDSELGDAFFVFINRGVAPARAYELFVMGHPEEAERTLAETIRVIEHENYEPVSREKEASHRLLATLHSYAAFMALVRGDLAAGMQRLEAAEHHAGEVGEDVLTAHPFNIAFVLAMGGDFRKAAERAEECGQRMSRDQPSRTVMLMYLALPEDWSGEIPRLAGELELEEVKEYVELHRLLYLALDGSEVEKQTLAALAPRRRHHATLRVLAWARHRLTGDTEGAFALIEEAREHAPEPRHREIDEELSYLRRETRS